MAVPIWVPGQVLSASDVNTWLAPNAVTKPGDESVTSSTVLQNDNDLILAVAASASYTFKCCINYEGGTQGSSDFKWQWSIPSGTMRYGCVFVGAGGGVTVSAQVGSDIVTAGTNGAGNRRSVFFQGSVVTGGSAGNVMLTWAQNTSSATATIIHAQSTFEMQRTA